MTAPGSEVAVVSPLPGLDLSALPAVLTPAQVALIFGSDPKTVTRWEKAGKLTAITTPGGHRRFPARQPVILDAIRAIIAAGSGQ
jgi:hypothetical protein